MTIKSGTPCFLSQRGHNNFIYPIFDETGLTHFKDDIEDYEVQAWVCGNKNLRAIIVCANQLDSVVCTTDARLMLNKTTY